MQLWLSCVPPPCPPPWSDCLPWGCGLDSALSQAQGPSSFSFSTDDDNDVEVEALEGDSELNLVTEVWVEPQYGRVGPGPESWKHLQDLTYSEIPQAVSDLRRTPTPYQIGYYPLGSTTACGLPGPSEPLGSECLQLYGLP